MGTFYQSKKVNFLELSFLTDISGKFPHSAFLKEIPAFPQEESSRRPPPLFLAHSRKLTKQKT
jgi:hypothetical protein